MNVIGTVGSHKHLKYIQEQPIYLHKLIEDTARLTKTSRKCRTSDATSSSSETSYNRRASSTDIINILDAPFNQTCPPASKKINFWDSGIIAERKNKMHKKAKDYLVEALPVWRRAGVDGGPESDHIEAWEAMKKDIGFHLESEKYDFVVQRVHPRFGRWTGTDEVFARGLEMGRKTERDDERDKEKAMEMLGYLIKRIVEEVDAEVQGWLLDHWGDVFTNTRDGTSGVVTTPREASARGWQLMRNTPRTDRQDIGNAIVFHKRSPICGLWTNAFCIALLPPDNILAAWKEKGIEERPKRYRSAITAFLEAYHNDGIHNEESFIYVLRTYYTLTRMLRRTEKEDTQGAEYHDSIYDNSSKHDSDVYEDERDNTHDIERESEEPSSDYNDDTSFGDDQDDEDWEPETEETRMKALEEAARKEAEGPASGKRVTRRQKRTQGDASGEENGSGVRGSAEAEGNDGNKKVRM
jgi:hypothetical protein